MVKWLVRVNASMAERISGISSNPADDLAFAKICTKDEEKIFVSCYSGWNSCFDSSEREILKMSSFHRSSPTHSREIFKEKSLKSNLRVTSVHNSVITNTGVWGGRKGWWGGEAGGAAAYYESFLPNWTFLPPHFVSDCRCGRVRVKSCS